jgi:hypothetical protein
MMAMYRGRASMNLTDGNQEVLRDTLSKKDVCGPRWTWSAVMTMHFPVVIALLGLAVIPATATLSGCGAEEQEDSPAPGETSVASGINPEFATAEATLNRYNLLTANTTIDLHSYLAMVKAETSEHAAELDQIGRLRPLLEMEQASWDVLGAAMFPLLLDQPPLRIFVDAANIVESDESRARAEQGASDGSTRSVYFVKEGGRWWISSYTLQYNPNLFAHREYMRDAPPGALELGVAAAPTIMQRILSREYRSTQAARDAFIAQMKQIFDASGSGHGYIPFGQ